METPINELLTVDSFVRAICTYEGGYTPGDRAFRSNNPGDLRDGKGGFRTFDSWEEGYQALKNMVLFDISGKSTVYSPNDTIASYMAKYAPTGDSNDPLTYANFIGKRLSVNPQTFKMSQLTLS